MSTFDAQNIESTSGGAPDFSQGLNVGGSSITSLITMTEYYSQAGEPSSPANGAVWWDGSVAYQYVGGAWRILSVTPPPNFLGNKALFFRGTAISTVSIPTLGNASSFGTTSATSYSALSNGTRAVTGLTSTMEYVTIATAGNGTNFGNLSLARQYTCGASNLERGLFAGGAIDFDTDNNYARIDYITIATTGNATFFGNLNTYTAELAAVSDDTYAVFSNGPQWFPPFIGVSVNNGLVYVSFATLGNAVTFGTVTQFRGFYAGVTDKTYGVFGGGALSDPGNGGTIYNILDRITIATPGNAVDFGDLTAGRSQLGAASNGERGVFAGGWAGSNSNVLDYITIATPGNATDFGDLITAGTLYSGCSGN